MAEARDLLALALLAGAGYYAYTKLGKPAATNTGIVPGGFVSNAPGNTASSCTISQANLKAIAQVWNARLVKDYASVKQILAGQPVACRHALGAELKAIGASWTWVDTALIPGNLPGS